MLPIQPFCYFLGFDSSILYCLISSEISTITPCNTDISAREMKIIDGKYRCFYFTRTQRWSSHKKSSAFSAWDGETTLCWQYAALWNELLSHCLTRPNGKQHCASFIFCCLYIVRWCQWTACSARGLYADIKWINVTSTHLIKHVDTPTLYSAFPHY